jgi:RNA polymerase sigma-70 factor, ECF subfamily
MERRATTDRSPDSGRAGRENEAVTAERDVSESGQHELESLMALYQQADAAAAAALVARLSPRLYRFFASQAGNRDDADDMLQDLWLRIHRVRHTYRPGQPFLPWAYAIAHRVRIDNYRRRRRSKEIAVDVLPERAAPRERASHGPAFADLMAILPDGQREVLTMLKVDGLSLEEIARATASTVGAVKQKAHRAYTRLRQYLQHDSEPPGEAAAP